MNTNYDIGKVLMRLDDKLYEKGMRKITVTLKNVRKGRLSNLDKKLIIPQLVRSKDSGKFIKQFLKNIEDDLNELDENEEVKKIVLDPNNNLELLKNCDEKLLYLYLVRLQKEEYDEVLMLLLDEICNTNDQINEEIKTINENTEKEECKILCENYKNEIVELKKISKLRKEKIKEMEVENNILNEENARLKKEIEELKIKINELLEYKNLVIEKEMIEQECQNHETERTIGIIANVRIFKSNKTNGIVEMSVNEYIEKEENERDSFDEILVCKRNIPISKLRKIKKISNDNIVFFDLEQDILKHLNAMEERYENGRN